MDMSGKEWLVSRSEEDTRVDGGNEGQNVECKQAAEQNMQGQCVTLLACFVRWKRVHSH